MALKLLRGLPAANAWAEHIGSDEARHTARHVDHAGARKVDDARHHVVGVASGHEAVTVPDPVDDDGVDETGDEDGVEDVRGELPSA